MRVVVKEPGKAAYEREIKNYAHLQWIIKAPMRAIWFAKKHGSGEKVYLIINAQGDNNGMNQENFVCWSETVYGTAFFVGRNENDFVDCPISAETVQSIIGREARMKTSEFIKMRRLTLGMTMKQLAERVGVSAATISRWESGHIENMRIDHLRELAPTLQITLDELVFGTGGSHGNG